MKRKVTVVIDRDADEEIVIRCRALTPEIEYIKSVAESGGTGNEIMLELQGREYFMPLSDVLFFESASDKTAAHTQDKMLYTDKTLRELEGTLPGYFARVSKSCLLNVRRVSSMKRSVSGVCEVWLDGDVKKVYVSRMYYKGFREKLTELRLQ
ncbi:MAG: LytTR family transcriptional regulator [Clostridia bacterium]|nr:LytTR family transcriptional regulator [Clostridia bacterium]